MRRLHASPAPQVTAHSLNQPDMLPDEHQQEWLIDRAVVLCPT